MRIFNTLSAAGREIERDIFEMGIDVHPQTMQDKLVANDAAYNTKELQAYGFKLHNHTPDTGDMAKFVSIVMTGDREGKPTGRTDAVCDYITREHQDRICGIPMNPGRSYVARKGIWEEFLHDGLFAYTYSERMTPQVMRILQELTDKPDTRQAIINIHSNIAPTLGMTRLGTGALYHVVQRSADMMNMGGTGRIPCSMYYQVMIRNSKVDLIYTMRSCDFLTHFAVDISLAVLLQKWFAENLGKPIGNFTYFTGSLHAYAKDLAERGIF
jgi:hypothetical protein